MDRLDLWGQVAHRWMNDRKARFHHVTALADLDRHLAETPDAVDDQAFDFALAEIGRGHEGVACRSPNFGQPSVNTWPDCSLTGT